MMMKEVEKSRKRKIQELFSFQVFSLPWKVEKEHWKSLGIIKKCFVFWFFPLQTFFSTSFSGVSAFDGSYQHQQSSYIYIISTSSQPFHRMTFSSLDMFGKITQISYPRSLVYVITMRFAEFFWCRRICEMKTWLLIELKFDTNVKKNLENI